MPTVSSLRKGRPGIRVGKNLVCSLVKLGEGQGCIGNEFLIQTAHPMTWDLGFIFYLHSQGAPFTDLSPISTPPVENCIFFFLSPSDLKCILCFSRNLHFREGCPKQTLQYHWNPSSCFLFLFKKILIEPHSMWKLRSETRDQTHTPCTGRWNLNHWTTREVCFWLFSCEIMWDWD